MYMPLNVSRDVFIYVRNELDRLRRERELHYRGLILKR